MRSYGSLYLFGVSRYLILLLLGLATCGIPSNKGGQDGKKVLRSACDTSSAAGNSIEEVTQLLERCPDSYRLYRLRAHLYHAQANRDSVVMADMQRAIALMPEDADLYADMSSFKLDKGDIDASIKYATEGIARDSTNAACYFYRSHAYAQAGNTVQAHSDSAMAARLDSVKTRHGGITEEDLERMRQ